MLRPCAWVASACKHPGLTAALGGVCPVCEFQAALLAREGAAAGSITLLPSVLPPPDGVSVLTTVKRGLVRPRLLPYGFA